MSRAVRGAGAALVVLLLVACGVPLSETADPVPDLGSPSARPSGDESTAATPETSSTPAPQTATVWYVEGSRLVPRGIAVARPLTSQAVLLLLGTPPEGSVDLRTLIVDPLGGPPLAAWAEPADSASPAGAQLVQLSPTFGELAAEDQVLLLGQVVLTLTEVDGRPVQFVDGALTPLSVPLPDGRLRDGPVTRGDYSPLT